MRIGILKTGSPAAELEPLVGSYAAMIRAALGSAYAYMEFDSTKGHLPDREARADAYVITGSPAGVHDGDPWIAQLAQWLVEADPAVPLVGICFGHQLMAKAYGGVVGMSRSGWASGLCEYQVRFRERWMDDATRLVLPAANRDQVTRCPAGARVIATSAQCPCAALSYGDRRAISFQAHPEFSTGYAAMLIDRYERMCCLSAAQAAQARMSLTRAHDCARVAGWIRRFVERC